MPTTNGHGSPPERVALYLRVSSEEQREKATIKIQREFLDGYCQLHGLEVAGWYQDDGVSGTIPLHERPEGRRLLEDAKEGTFETVLVYRLDRFGRSLLGIVDAHDRLETLHVALRSTTEPVDTSNPSGRLIFQMLASFAEYERGTIRERTQAGLHRAYRDGKQSGIIPYGFDVDEDGQLRIVEEEAQIVREIISNVAEGSTLYGEATRLNALSIPGPGRKYGSNPRTPSERWTVSTLSKMVHRSTYSGTRRYSINSGANLIECEAPPIIEPELQAKAVSRLAENRRFNRRAGDRKYLLAGLITCEVCGSSCVGNPSKARGTQRYYYVCGENRPERRRRAGKGHAPYVRAEWLENLVWSDMRRFLENPGEVLEQLREQMGSDDVLSELEGRRESLEKRLAVKHKERDRWLHLYAQGHISDAELEMHLADLRAQLDNLKLLLGYVEDELEGRRARVEVAESAETWLMTLRERVEELEEGTEEALEKRRELAKLLVERIGVGRDEDGHAKVEITYRFDPPPEPPDEPPGERGTYVDSVSNPQGWADPTPRPGAETFTERRRELGLSPVAAHAKYLINLASPHEDLRRRSAEALARELVAAGALGVDLVVVHAGSHGGDGEEKGMDRLVEGLDRVRELAASFTRASTPVAEPVVENSVGAGTQLCSTLDSLGEVVRRAGVRVCLDTAHAFVAGHDLSTPDGARSVAEEFKNAVGLALALVHLNDARNGLGSHRDGHSKIGEGQIPEEAWRGLFDGLPGIPAVMESPYGGPEADAEEVRLVKELAGGLPVSPRAV